MPIAPDEPVVRYRFLLELWVEPREVATRIRRLRGRILDLTTRRSRSVGGLQDVDAFIQASVAASTGDPETVEWERGS